MASERWRKKPVVIEAVQPGIFAATYEPADSEPSQTATPPDAQQRVIAAAREVYALRPWQTFTSLDADDAGDGRKTAVRLEASMRAAMHRLGRELAALDGPGAAPTKGD